MIEYILEPNELVEDAEKFRAQVINSRSYTFEDIARRLIKRNSGLSLPEITGVWEGIKDVVEEIIAEGGIINTELFRVRASIKGVFNGTDDKFDASRHEIRLNLRTGQLLHGTPKKLKTKKRIAPAKSLIQSVTDVKSGAVNSHLTPGKNIKIIGTRLKIDGKDPSCGLYFVPEKTTDAAVKVEASEFAMNNPSQIIVVIPALKKGKWHLRLVTQYSRTKKHLRQPQTVTFGKVLTVA
jgi:hypothetical protein